LITAAARTAGDSLDRLQVMACSAEDIRLLELFQLQNY
jgi:hypothetical protein